MARETTTVSLKGSAAYVRAFRRLADDMDTEMGILVREALDAKFGDAIEERLLFFAKFDAHKHQSKHESEDDGSL